MSTVVRSRILGPLVTFVPIFGILGLVFIGIQLENPFGSDDNDLPLEHFQHEMNSCLLMLLHPDTDLIAGLDEERCKYEFLTLEGDMRSSYIDPNANDGVELKSTEFGYKEKKHKGHVRPPRLTEF